MVDPIKDEETGEWRVGGSPGAYKCGGPEYKRVFAIVMKLQKNYKVHPFRVYSPSTWIDRHKPDWVADPAPFIDCWNCINQNFDYKLEEILKRHEGTGICLFRDRPFI